MSFNENFGRIKGAILYGLLVTICSGAIFGYGSGIISNVVKRFYAEEFLSNPDTDYTNQQSIITSAAILGAFIASPVSGFIADTFGRKTTLIIGTVLSLVGNAVCLLASPKYYLVFAGGRLIFGFSLGFISSIGPLYMAETSPADLRGFLGVFFQFSITFTIFLSALTDFFPTSVIAWRLTIGLLFLPIVIMGIVVLISPESPRFLVGKDVEKARKLFGQIYSNPSEIDDEIEKIRLKNTENAGWGELFTSHGRALFIGVVLAVAQQLTGINAIIYYSGIFANQWFEPDQFNVKAGVFSGLMGWNCFTSMVSIPLTKKYGRRTLLLIGQGIIISSLFLSFLSFFFGSAQIYFTILGIAMFILGFEISVGPLFFVLINEIFPEKLRGRIGSVMTGLQWFFNFALTLSFPHLIKIIQPDVSKPNGYVFLIFFGFGALAFIYQLLYLPETRNLSFKEIQEIMQQGGVVLGKN